MQKIFFKFSIFLILTSCASTSKTVEVRSRIYNDDPLNVILNKEIGDKLILSGIEDYQDGIKLIECPIFKMNKQPFKFSKGDIIPLMRTKGNLNLYYDKNEISNDNYEGIAVDKKNINIVYAFFYSFARGGITTKKVEGVKVEIAPYVSESKNNFKQEFIFNGKSSNNLKFIYREYINDMARPAFNQDLQYDLNESKIIGFKGLRIEILNVTNTNIEYKILSSFTKR